MGVLSFTAGPRYGQQHRFEGRLVLGRGESADFDLADPAVSKRHALIHWVRDTCMLSDLGSQNGTYVNGHRVVIPVPLADGDQVVLGNTHLRLLLGDGVDAPAEPAIPVILDEGELNLTDSIRLPIDDPSSRGAPPAGAVARFLDVERKLDFFRDVARILTETVESEEILPRLVDLVLELVPHARRAFFAIPDEAGNLVPRASRTRGDDAAVVLASRTLLEVALAERQAVLVVDAAKDQRYKISGSMLELHLRSAICVPLVLRDTLYGVLQVDNTWALPPLDEEDLRTLVTVGATVVHALANAELHRQLLTRRIYEHDLMLARRIQQLFLPDSLPEISDYEFAATYTPALDVGGDLYDVLPMPDGTMRIVLGDVSGKGVSGALLMARVMSDLRFLASRGRSAAQALSEINDQLGAFRGEGMFVTMIYALLDPSTGRLQLANAGHLPPVLRRLGGGIELVDLPSGLPLGVDGAFRFPVLEMDLRPGDAILFYSDGLVEAPNGAGDRFGIERLIEAVRKSDGEVHAVLAAAVTASREFMVGGDYDDDLTIVCVSRSR
jgi:serine phosphatase RsbU (regulator of sigma subunit)